jgi:hypothetical protein
MWQCHCGLFWSLHFIRVLAEPLCDPIGGPEGGVYLSGPQGTGAQYHWRFCSGVAGGFLEAVRARWSGCSGVVLLVCASVALHCIEAL